jgi:hypothetical protein
MSILTYEIARHAPARNSKRQGFFAGLYARVIEARRQTAMRELRRHAHLLPDEFERAGWKINERSEDSLPFVR